MIKIKIVQTEDTKKFLKEFPGMFRSALLDGFKKAMYFLEGEVKKSFGDTDKPKVRTGALRRSITTSINIRQRRLVGTLGSDLIYAPVQELGAVIKPKKNPFMRFMIGDRWVTLKQVTIPARPYLEPTVKENTDEVSDIITSHIVGAVNK